MRIGHETGVELGDGFMLGAGNTAERQAVDVDAAIEHRDLTAENCRQAHRLCSFGETNHTVETVVIGDRQCLQPEASGPRWQALLGAMPRRGTRSSSGSEVPRRGTAMPAGARSTPAGASNGWRFRLQPGASASRVPRRRSRGRARHDRCVAPAESDPGRTAPTRVRSTTRTGC